MPDIFVAPDNPKIEEMLKANRKNVIHKHMFASFCRNPTQIYFQTQEHDEVILLFLRRHFITNVPWIFITFVLIIAPLIFTLLNAQFSILGSIHIPGRFITIFILFYYLILLSYIFINFIEWFYNVFLVTQKRVIDIDYSNIVIHNLSVTKLTHVQDVSYTQSGFIRSLFNYGDVFVQTAGTERNFEALRVPNPRDAAHIIGNFIGKGAHAA